MNLPKRADTIRMLKRHLYAEKVDATQPRYPGDGMVTYKRPDNTLEKRREMDAWHWGLVELRHFLDELYGGPPKAEDEELNKEDR